MSVDAQVVQLQGQAHLSGNEETTVASLDLRSGSYVAFARATQSVDVEKYTRFRLALATNPGRVSRVVLGTGPHIVAEDEVWTDSWISLMVAGTLDHDGSVELACTAADAWVTNVRLVVISVDSVKPVVLLGEPPEPPSLGDR